MEYDSVITSRPVLPTGTTWMKLEGVMPSKVKVKVLVAQSCPTLCDPMDCSPPGSFVHGIFQARVLESYFDANASPEEIRNRVKISNFHFSYKSIFQILQKC